MCFQQVSLKALSRVRLSAQNNACTGIRQLPRRWATTRTAKSLAKKPNGPPKKRHNATNFTTATLNFQHSAILESSRSSMAKPSVESLKTLFVASAIPMVGFGFMDNFVMIQAGQYIDSTLGVSLGLATMTAAAAGQVISDVSGVIFGGSLERFLMRMSLIRSPALTAAQRQLPICRNVAMAGAVLGVIVGCALGATTLLLVDLEARDRISRAMQLREIVTDMISDEDFACETCTVYIASDGDFTLDKSEQAQQFRTRLEVLSKAKNEEVQECARDQCVLREETGRFLYAPVVQDGQITAVLEFRHKSDQEGDALQDGFTEADTNTVKIMARHLGIVLKHAIEA